MRPRLFISYRTDDEPFAAALIDRALVDHFGPRQVFRDSRTIRPGTHFIPELWQALHGCRALVAVIGSRWFGVRCDGGRAIDDPHDYVRREIAEALERDISVVPILVGDTQLPRAEDLPSNVAEMANRQYLRLRIRDVEYDLLRLTKELEEQTG